MLSENRLPPGAASENWAKLWGAARAIDAHPTASNLKKWRRKQTERVSIIRRTSRWVTT